jgi:cobalamin-dependent methionine synthase I
MLGEIAPECKSIVGLSNVSNGVPGHLRGYFNRTSLITFMKYGLHAAICDTLDSELMSIARGEMQDVVQMVHDMMDGALPDPNSLSAKQMEYYKTYRVLSGQVLYSDSWLEI